MCCAISFPLDHKQLKDIHIFAKTKAMI